MTWPGHEIFLGHASTPDLVNWEVHDPVMLIRPDSWEECEVGGKAALSFVADYLAGAKEMVEYCVYSLGDSNATEFCTKVAKNDFDGFKDKFDAIVSTYKAD